MLDSLKQLWIFILTMCIAISASNAHCFSQTVKYLSKDVTLNEVKIKAKPIKQFIQKGKKPIFPIMEFRIQVTDTVQGKTSRVAYLNKIPALSNDTISFVSTELKLEPFSNEIFDVYFLTMQFTEADTMINRKLINGSLISRNKCILNFEKGDFILYPQDIFFGVEVVPKNVGSSIFYPLYTANNSQDFYQYWQYGNKGSLTKAQGMGITFNLKIKYR